METPLKGRPNRLGIYLAGAYVLLVVGVFAFIASGKPSGLGYEIIPLTWLAAPWYYLFLYTPWWDMDERVLCILGFILNAGILYLLGALFEKLRRPPFSK